MNLPNDMIMKEMARIAIEQATEMFAQKAMELSTRVPAGMTAREALIAFAEGIRGTNLELYGKGRGK